jgi:hypothetical protein
VVSNIPATPPDNVWTNTDTTRRFDMYRIDVTW